MKQTIAFMMAVAMLACTLSMTTFAATIVYPVSGISSTVYVPDDEGDLYIGKTSDKVSYGKTAYFPLLSDGSNAVSAAKTAWQNAVTAKTTADNAYTTAKAKYDAAYKALDEYNAAATALGTAEKNLKNYTDNIDAKNDAVTTAETNLKTAKQNYQDAVTALEAEAWKTATPPIDSGEWPTYLKNAQDLVTSTQKIQDEKNTAFENAKKERDALGDLTALNKAVTDAQTTVDTKKSALYSATGKSTVADATSAVNTLKSTMDEAAEAQTTAATKVTTTYAAYEAAQKNTYKYVYETDATKSVKITKKWEESGTYVSSVEVVKKRVRDDISGASSSSMQYIYFLAIKIKSSTSTQDRDLLGTVTLKKSGSDGFEVSTDISLEIGYSSASDTAGEGVIPKTPATFKKGDGFDEDSDFEFEFEADGDSYFAVSTVGQGSIVLGFDTEYDDDIGDKYPNADLWFYNGNYASFNRVGTLYLSYPDDDGYVYEISKSGELTRIDPDYDDSEEAYAIRTRTLGRYVISDTKLKVTSSSSSSSSSSGSGTGSGTGTGTGGTGTAVVPTASSTPSYTYTPPAASSSAAPPAQSSSSSEPEEESESEPEELEDEDDDIVDVVVDDEEVEGPEEKSGIPTWVWAMIIVGLAAVPVGIGVVYYLHSRPLRRDFFNGDEDGYEDDDDEE